MTYINAKSRLPFLAACLVFLLLGILNHVRGNFIDLVIGIFVFGFVSFVTLYKYVFLERIAIWVLIGCFLVSAWVTGAGVREFLARDLPLYTYNNDPGVFLKTYLLTEQNTDYYEAYKTAQLGRFAQPTVPRDIWGFRLPTLTFIWKILPGTNGLAIYYFFLGLSSLTLLVAHKIGSRYLGSFLGLLSPYLLFNYFHFAARDQMFLETEWWSVCVFIVGMYCLVVDKKFWAVVLLSLTVLIREVYILPIGFMLAYAVFLKRRLIGTLAIPLVAFVFLYYFHISAVSAYINSWGTLLSPRVISNGTLLIQQTLAFASWEYLLYSLRPFLIVLVAAVVGCGLLLRTEKKDEAVLWLLAFVPFPIAFLRFGSVPYNDYWGIMYVPLSLILAPVLLRFFGGWAKGDVS